MLHNLNLLKKSYESNKIIVKKLNDLIGAGLYSFELLDKENTKFDGWLDAGYAKWKLELKQRQDTRLLPSIMKGEPVFAPLYVIQTHYQKEHPIELVSYIIFDKTLDYAILCDSGNFERKTITENDITKYKCKGYGLFFDFKNKDVYTINLKTLKILR